MNSSDADEKTACPTRRPRLPALPTAPAPAPDLSPLSIPGPRSPHLSRAAGRSSHSHTRAHGTRDAHAPLSSSPGRWRGAVLAFHHLGSWCSRDAGRNLAEKKQGTGSKARGFAMDGDGAPGIAPRRNAVILLFWEMLSFCSSWLLLLTARLPLILPSLLQLLS